MIEAATAFAPRLQPYVRQAATVCGQAATLCEQAQRAEAATRKREREVALRVLKRAKQRLRSLCVPAGLCTEDELELVCNVAARGAPPASAPPALAASAQLGVAEVGELRDQLSFLRSALSGPAVL